MKVPFVNLERQINRLRPELEAAFHAVLDSREFILGSFVERFEEEFAEAHQAPYCVGCSNGTSAISLLLEALGIGRGDEVITQTNTFFATAEAICNVGATPVFVDCTPGNYSIDCDQVERAVTARTKAVIPVHLYGNPCDLVRLTDIAARHGLNIIEDAAQAHLATYRGRPVGTFGEGGTFSFFPGKNLGAFGDAGAIIVSSEELALRLRKLRNHGRIEKYKHDAIGYNHRMDDLQAAFLSVKMRYLGQWTENRRRIAALYDEALADRGIQTVQLAGDCESSRHLYVIEVENRDEVAKKLADAGIATGIHYPIPLHQQPAFAEHSQKPFPVAEQSALRLLSLPLCGEIERHEAEYVIETLDKIF